MSSWGETPILGDNVKVPEQDGLKILLESAGAGVSHLKHLWLDAGYERWGKRWAEEVLGLSVQIVRKPPKPNSEKVAMIWVEEWAKEGEKVDWQRLMLPRGFTVQQSLPAPSFPWFALVRPGRRQFVGRPCTLGRAADTPR